MSPAPVRQPRNSSKPFPHVWGYWLGAVVVLLGIGVAVFGVIRGIQGFTDDVQDLRRVVGGNGLEASLEAGDELLVYDEADLSAGPFDVTVIRTSDGAEVATTAVVDGTTYDVDGRSGEAKVGFRVPSSDIYRIEVDTSLGQVARFAVGNDVGNDRANTMVGGLVWGGILALIGFGIFVWTMVLHARWKLRDAVLDQVATARETIHRSAASDRDAGDRRDSGANAGAQATSWAREQLEQTKAKLPVPSEADHGRAPAWRESLTARARDGIEAAESQLSTLEPAIGDAAANADVPDNLIGRVGEALDRIESRVVAGEPLRDIARDERVVAEETARELAAQAKSAQQETAARLQAAEASVRERAAGEIERLSTDLSGIGTTAFDDMASQVNDASDELTIGLAATAGAAVAGGAAAANERARDVLGFEIDEPERAAALPDPPTAPTSPPAPPSSALSAPPASALPPPPATQPWPVAATVELPAPAIPPAPAPPPATQPGPVAATVEPAAPAPPPAVIEPAPATEAIIESEPGLEVTSVRPTEAPVPSEPLGEQAPAAASSTHPRSILAPPPAAMARGRTGEPADEAEPAAGRRGSVDSFSALAPPPEGAPRLAPPPMAQGLTPPPATIEAGSGSESLAEERDIDQLAPTDELADEDQVAHDRQVAESAEARSVPSTGTFSLAPPPDYSSLSRS